MRGKGISDSDILEAYERTGNVWRAGRLIGICGQSVHERLVKLGVPRNIRKFTDEEASQVRTLYARGFKKGDGQLKKLAKNLDRNVSFLCGKASRMGLTNKNRTVCSESTERMSKSKKEWFAKNDHPRGMKGKNHTLKTRESMSRSHKKLWRNKSPEERNEFSRRFSESAARRIREGTMKRPEGSWKDGWRDIGGQRIYFRSSWEANYARFLEFLKEKGEILSWAYEPKTFHFEKSKDSPLSYTPDFLVVYPDAHSNFHEVKGWIDERSLRHQERMALFYPEVELMVRSSSWFRANSHLRYTVPGWESSRKTEA